jgi:plasmid maintenance system killer protein
MTKKIKLRLAALQAAESLADLWPPKSPPERCHELKGDRAGVFSVDLKHPYRMLFKPSPDEVSRSAGEERGRWRGITSIEVIGVEDTHE